MTSVKIPSVPTILQTLKWVRGAALYTLGAIAMLWLIDDAEAPKQTAPAPAAIQQDSPSWTRQQRLIEFALEVRNGRH